MSLMKPTAQIISLVGLLTSLTSCSFFDGHFCPAHQKLGQLQLTNPGFSPYRGNETLTFSNGAGQQLTLANFDYATLATQQRLIVSTPCYKNDWNKQQLYYESPRIFIHFRPSQSDYRNTISYSFGMLDLRVDQSVNDTLLAEDLTIYNNFTKPNTALRVLTSDRGNRARFDPVKSQYPRLIQYRIIADTLLNGRTYQQVYCAKEAPSLFSTSNLASWLSKMSSNGGIVSLDEDCTIPRYHNLTCAIRSP